MLLAILLLKQMNSAKAAVQAINRKTDLVSFVGPVS